MKDLKVMTILGTRPELIRLSRLIPLLNQFTNHILVHTGQNSDEMLKDVFFADLELRQPDYYLGVDNSSAGSAMADVIKKSEELLKKEMPDAVVILGDTNSSMAAIIAERLGIPVYHMEAGNRSFDSNVPEELNRRVVDHVSSFNLPYSEHARRNLLAEGLHPRFIHKTGSPIGEIYDYYKSKIQGSNVLKEIGLESDGFFLVSVHRQENVDDPKRLQKVLDCLKAVRDEWDLPLLVSTHPRTKSKLEQLSSDGLDGIHFHKPFGYLDYNKLQLEAKCVISDSGSISEEAAIMNFPAVTIRDSMERPEALEIGAILMTGLEPDAVVRNIKISTKQVGYKELPDDYKPIDFSTRVLSVIQSTASQVGEWKGLR